MAGQYSLLNICRLCMKSGELTDIFKIDDIHEISLYVKTTSCIDIKLQLNDGLSSLICEVCEKIINDFYDYKIKCREVDEKLRSMDILLSSTNINIDYNNEHLNRHIKLEYHCNNIKETINDWLLDEQKSDVVSKEFDFYERKEISIEDITYSEYSNVKNSVEESYIKPYKLINKKKKDKKVHQCEFCGRMFKTKSVLTKHIITHTGEKLYGCNICHKKFTREAHKIVHMRIHSGLRPFVCDTCGKASTKRQDLIRHMRIHSDEKNYSCSRCDRKFKRSGDVQSHMRTHTGVRPYSCKYCEKTYSCHSGLKKHYTTHHRKKDAENILDVHK